MAKELKETIGEREREVLRAVVENHFGNSAPVGSRTLSRHGLAAMHLSPATIRNIMADLDDKGLIEKPHSSAGRVPTETGYRYYVEELMEARPVPARQRKQIDDFLEKGSDGAENLAEKMSLLLVELSHQAGVILFPRVAASVIEKFHFVVIAPLRVQVVLVLTGGRAQNMVVELDEAIPENELVELANFLNHKFSRRTLSQIRQALLRDISEGNERVLKMRARALAINEMLVSGQEVADVLVEGAPTLIDVPEFRNDAGKLKKLLKLLADKRKLLAILDKCLDGRQVAIEIGSGIEEAGLNGCALVARSYGYGETRDGAIGVIGPRRMDYPYLVGLLDYLSAALGNRIKEGNG
ncbi:MAG: heat-inducible transcription repressor HrcA [Nitrospinae bacterium]|nr:heat-inducible transcription repressor HrcA [Nitrospinota bacterium]